ncbi:MFS general substrate transporter [Nadsonia fulvescens var. elongata DSM 6958]|uniref:MFS general substrate transporter n=1 Tax=Nadsonia fulvescens var. elongata DSM 6958 TaxID=857566 RepID=A0A1E3PRR6_9ASCO|nr:MFS general substrate transporter [Nadsonia fulvescens var. elongata DSM 6958]
MDYLTTNISGRSQNPADSARTIGPGMLFNAPLSEKTTPIESILSEDRPQEKSAVVTFPDPEVQTPAAAVSSPPDGGYGWVCVGAVFVFNMCTWGANSAFAVYLAHYLADNKYPGATKVDYALIGGFSVGLGLFCAPAITYLNNFLDTRQILALGILFSTGATVSASFTNQIWQLYLSQGILQGIGLGFIFVPNIAIVPQWFAKKRTLANGIAAGGSGLGGIMFSLSMQAIIKRWSVSWALRAQAMMCFVLGCSAIMLVRTRNHHIKPDFKFFDSTLLKIWGFIWLLFWVSFTMLGYVIILYSLSDFSRSIGLNSSQGSVVASMTSVGICIGRPLVGYLSDIYGRINVSILAHVLVFVFVFAIWIPCKNYATAIAFGILAGGTIGTIWVSCGTLTADVVGLKRLPSGLTIIWIAVGVTGIFSQAIGLQLKNENSATPYLGTQIFTGFMYVGASISLALLRGWKIQQNAAAKGEHIGFFKSLFGYSKV